MSLEVAEFISTHNVCVIETETYEQLIKNNEAFEIIKNNFEIAKPIGIDIENNKVAFVLVEKKDITREEFNLLKEVLK